MTAALDGIDDIDWASLDHAYGPAEDLPQTLRDAREVAQVVDLADLREVVGLVEARARRARLAKARRRR
ncbi:hypothetical protein ACWENQ_23510 [Nonomuraea sp. NPDC004354]